MHGSAEHVPSQQQSESSLALLSRLSPLTAHLPRNPRAVLCCAVVAADGVTYEQEALTDWLDRWVGARLGWAGSARRRCAMHAGKVQAGARWLAGGRCWLVSGFKCPRPAAPRLSLNLTPHAATPFVLCAPRRGAAVSPLTGQPLAHPVLFANTALRGTMQEVAQLVRELVGA